MCGHCQESQPFCQVKSTGAALERVLTVKHRVCGARLIRAPFRFTKSMPCAAEGRIFHLKFTLCRA